MFFPRGGSATVARALARRLPELGWDTTLLSGSIPDEGDAEQYYADLDVRPVHFGTDAPLHPSYEEPGVFAAVGDDELERHVEAWATQLEAAGAADADVLHLHHLTPINEAAARVAPDVPIVGHLHGTELLMLERIADGPPAGWAHADAWVERMRAWAQACECLIVPSRLQLPRVERLLGTGAAVLPNGVDLELFDRRVVDRPAETTVIFVGRFTAVKRIGLLIEAWAAAEPHFDVPASLAIVGGYPGEAEGEHPAEAIARTGARHVHLAGWQPQERLPAFLNAADVLVLPSVREQFGLAIVEAMACGLPPIAVDVLGPKDIVEPGRTGWLVPPDDRDALAAAIIEAVNDPAERLARIFERAAERSLDRAA
ncbi:MAG: glycosyltransferase family 4 protein [Solirubrobacteraceae bacterium]